MSDRERREATEKFISRVNEERTKNMTDAEKAHFEKRQAAKKAERDKIAKMTEDERHDYFKKKHDEMVNARIKNMTPEEKKRFLERDKRQQERMEAFWKKWKQMTPEEKEQWKKAEHIGLITARVRKRQLLHKLNNVCKLSCIAGPNNSPFYKPAPQTR